LPFRATGRWNVRLAYVLGAAALVDLLAVLPFWISLFLSTDLRAILVFRVVRFLKLIRYSAAMRSLLDTLYAERRALFGCLVILIGTALIAASAMHLVEGPVQPAKFGTIAESMWWAIVTLGTIGYGDVVPVTSLGRVIATLTIFAGLIMIALPVGVVATAFADQIHRRDFVVTWGMVARVLLFAGLSATEIADVMRLLGSYRRKWWSRAASSCDAASRRAPCISLPRARSRLRLPMPSGCGSASANSSARSRCSVARAVRRQPLPCRVPTFLSSMATTSTR
jgi:voltage-gated potassium channel